MFLRKPAPAYPPGVLQIPSVYIIELLQVEVITCDDADRRDRGDARPEQQHVANCDLLSEATDESLK